MIITEPGYFKLMFENGYRISIFNGFGSYSDNYMNSKIRNNKIIASKKAEVAVMYEGIFVTEKFFENIYDNVKADVTPDELADLMYKVKNMKGEEIKK